MKMPEVETEYFPLAGGIDLTTQRLKLVAGRARSMRNYIGKLGGGYRRIGGYEPYDGHPSPSRQTYVVLFAASPYSGVALGDTVNGQTSGATGKVIEIFEGDLAEASYIAVTRVTGTFSDGENIRVGVTVVGVYDEGSDTSSLDGFDDNRLFALVEADYRADISAVPGEGGVLGFFVYNDIGYALRNNVGSTLALLYKESATGWTAVSLNEEIAFSNANPSVGVGDTLTQGGVTATIARMVVETGTLASGVNTGHMILTGRSGGNFGAGAATSTGGGSLFLTGIQVAITLAPDGNFSFVEYNFTGSSSTSRIYGADGENYGFEFDGTIWARIRTGMTDDRPLKVVAHKNQLFFSFLGSVQHSSPGTPFVWTPITGAAEIGMGSDVTGFLVVPGSESSGALMIFCRDRIKILYGSGVSDWRLTNFAEKIGSADQSLQMAGNIPMFVDSRGITTASATQNFGSFRAAVFTNTIDPLLRNRINNVVCSLVSRDMSQYWVFFDDMSGIVVTFGQKGVECLSYIELLHQPTCAWETERNGGEMFIGCDDGFVYQLERGRTFAGEPIEYFCLLAFTHSKSPLTRKQYRRAYIEVVGDSACVFNVLSSFDYDSIETDPNDPVTKFVNTRGGVYDVQGYDEIIYDSGDTSRVPISMKGFGSNVSIGINAESSDELPHELQAVLINFTPRRQERDYV